MAIQRLVGEVVIAGTLEVSGGVTAPIDRGNLILETAQVHLIPITHFRRWDAFESLLPGGGVADDLGVIQGAFGTFVPILRTLDLNALGAFQAYARALVTLPRDYIAGQPIQINVFGGMVNAVASVSASVDFAAYKSAGFNIAGADLVNTAAQSINSLSTADFPFDLITASLSPGDTIDLRVEVVGNSVTAVSHFAFVNNIELLYSARG